MPKKPQRPRRPRRRRKKQYKRKDYDPEYQKIRKQVFIRDKNLCQLCKKEKGKEIHHIIRHADVRVLRRNRLNLITLCKECHTKVTGKERIFAPVLFRRAMDNERECFGERNEQDYEDSG